MTPISAPLPNILLDDLKIHPELITNLFCREEDVSVMFTKRGNQIAVAYLRTYERDTLRILAEAKQEYALQQVAGYSRDQAVSDLTEVLAEIQQRR
jgi:hypothetical protein